MNYRVLVKSDDNFIGEFDSFYELTFSKRLNNYGDLSIKLNASDDKLSSLIALRQNTIYIYKGDTLLWSGEMAVRNTKLNVDGSGLVELIAYTWLEQLRARFTENDLVYEQVDAGLIAWDMIYRTQHQYIQTSTTLYPTVVTTNNIIGTINWDNPNNIKTEDDTAATIDFGATEIYSYYLEAKNFGFDIPINSKITGIVVNVKELNDEGITSVPYVNDVNVKLIKDGTIQNTNKSEAIERPVTVTTTRYGGISDLWNDTWLYSDINDIDFGVALSYKGKGSILNIYSVSITIHYAYPTESDTYDFGITKGVIEETMPRDRTYNNQNILEGIVNLTNVINGFDFEITDEKVFNVRTIIGEDKSQDIIIEYGSNILSADITQDLSNPINRVYLRSEVSDNDTIVEVIRNDVSSQTAIKLREDYQTEWNISETETLNEKGDALLRKYSTELMNVDIDISRNNPDIRSINVGDIVKLRIVNNDISIYENYRIFELQLNLQPDGSEKLKLILGKFNV